VYVKYSGKHCYEEAHMYKCLPWCSSRQPDPSWDPLASQPLDFLPPKVIASWAPLVGILPLLGSYHDRIYHGYKYDRAILSWSPWYRDIREIMMYRIMSDHYMIYHFRGLFWSFNIHPIQIYQRYSSEQNASAEQAWYLLWMECWAAFFLVTNLYV
jgi:hypothetical protein